MKSFADYDDAAALRAYIQEQVEQMLSAGVIKPVDWTGLEKKDVKIPTRDGQQIRAVVYKPENAEPGPLLVYYHGGGWTFGWPESWEKGFEVLTKQLGFTVVGVSYRLAPEHVFPTAANDACDALRWCAENAGSLGSDTSKGFIVAGASAGGNLAAVAAHDAVDAKLSPPVTGVVLMSATLVHSEAVPDQYRPHYKSRIENRDAMILDVRGFDWFLGKYYGAR
jgi:acetyl esterase/lipase